MSTVYRFGGSNIAVSLGQFVNNLTIDLPKVVRSDIDFKINIRRKRAGATTRNLAMFALDTKVQADKVTTHITDRFPFAKCAGDSIKPKQVFLSHDILVSDEKTKALSYKMIAEFERFIKEIEIDEESHTGYLQALTTAFERISSLMRECFVLPPKADISGVGQKMSVEDAEMILEVAIRRSLDPTYLIRKFKRLRKQYIEHSQVTLNNVGKKKNQHIYVSRYSFSIFKTQLRQAEEFLESMAVVNSETLQEFSLKEVAERTTANPKNRRSELIVRTRGDEERAIDMGFVGVFLNWTLPSKYHRNSRKWNGCTVKEAHKNLMDQWKLARAHFKKADIEWFGLRVAEPHKDGTPHAHMFLYVHPEKLNKLVNICAKIARSEDREELKTSSIMKKRFFAKYCDPTKGSATGYIIKYISKNINGSHMPESDAEEKALSVRAWASIWSIKQFSQSGSPAVGLWRQLRRANEIDTSFDNELNVLRDHANHSRWKGFCESAGTAKLAYEDKINQYGENTKRVIGFQWLEKVIETCSENYSLMKKSDVEAFKESRSGSPWSTENKCNQPQEIKISPLEKELMTVTGWSVKGVQCLIVPLMRGSRVSIDRYTNISFTNNRLLVN